MKHDFFLKQIGSVNDSLLNKLQNHVTSINYSINRKMWNPRHIGVDSIRYERGVICDEILQLMNSPGLLGHNNSFYNYEIIKLDSNGIIFEHSDIPLLTEKRCNSLSRVHVNIIGSADYYFRKTQSDEWTVLTMNIGGIYLFNNAAFHQVCNTTKETRYNVVLNYEGSLDIK